MPEPTTPPRKVALITGGARRVGRAVALRLGRAGYDLHVTYRSASAEGETLAAEAAALGSRCLLTRADLLDDAAPGSIAAAHLAAFGRLDVLMHNASIFPRAGLDDTTPAMIRETMKVHAEAPLLLTKQLAPLLRSSHGVVISMTDLAADRPFKGYLAYSASKAALQNLTLGLARSLAPEARANCIAPGAVEFPADMPEDARQAYLSKVPLARPGTPEDVAAAVLFLAENTFVTGTVLKLDGGRSLV